MYTSASVYQFMYTSPCVLLVYGCTIVRLQIWRTCQSENLIFLGVLQLTKLLKSGPFSTLHIVQLRSTTLLPAALTCKMIGCLEQGLTNKN